MMSIPRLGFFYMLHERFWIWNLVDNIVFFSDSSNVHLNFQLHACFLSLDGRHVVTCKKMDNWMFKKYLRLFILNKLFIYFFFNNIYPYSYLIIYLYMCIRLVEVKFVPSLDWIIISHFMWIIVIFNRAIFHALFFNQIYLSTHFSIYKRFFVCGLLGISSVSHVQCFPI